MPYKRPKKDKKTKKLKKKLVIKDIKNASPNGQKNTK